MKTTIDLPDELVREVKLRALMQGRTLRDVVADYIRQGLGAPTPSSIALRPPADSIVSIGANGLPVIYGDVDAPASYMTIEELLQLEQDALAPTGEELRRAGIIG
jgi:hypothetical protein